MNYPISLCMCMILLIVSAIKTVKSFREEHDFACLCENGFPSTVSEIVFDEKNLLLQRRSKEVNAIDSLYKENIGTR